ncbi:MAG: saccharopine dehydrogenase, partial [Desulfobacterales bacterium]|nr:saccharopine dehydrogenase [Desulfobacterales bacterium]
MKILVLGGCGIQGRTAIYDLAQNKEVEEVVCADARLDDLHLIEPFTEMSKVRPQKMDAGAPDSLMALFRRVDAAIDLLPAQFTQTVCRAAIQAGVHVVNTNYAYSIAGLDAQAREAGVTILPESGLDPGIDLIIYGEAGRRFDELHAIHSYCGGI